MKRLAMMLAVVCALAGAPVAVASLAPAAGTGPIGKYKTVVRHPKFVRGRWVIKFVEGHYRVFFNGKLVVKGKDRVKRNRIAVTDTGGPGRCHGTGKYTFKQTPYKLRFTEISETKSCSGRADVLSHTFTKVG